MRYVRRADYFTPISNKWIHDVDYGDKRMIDSHNRIIGYRREETNCDYVISISHSHVFPSFL